MKKDKIPNNVIRRLPKYLRMLNELCDGPCESISSEEIGRKLGLTPSQVRQDFSHFGKFGRQGAGYPVQDTRDKIAEILGTNRGFTAILLGVGNVGLSLINNLCFEKLGISLVGAFDVNERLEDTCYHGVPVYSMSGIEKYLQDNHIDIAVLCLPDAAARTVASLVSNGGVEAIWNFTNTDITEEGREILVENIHFSDSLLALSYYAARKKEKNAYVPERTAEKRRKMTITSIGAVRAV